MTAYKQIMLLLIFLFSGTAHGYFSTFDTAETLPENLYNLGFETQFISNKMPGVNVIGHYNTGIGEGQELKFLMGTGVVNFQMGAFYKWSPIPDTQNQPAIGGFFGLIYSNKDSLNMLNFRIHPLISKRFPGADGRSFITPYISLPFGITTGGASSTSGGSTFYPFQFETGVEWLPTWFKNTRILGELGFDISAAFSYVTIGLSTPFESIEKLKIE